MTQYYIKQNHGQELPFSPAVASVSDYGDSEFFYLLGQTLPFHQTEKAEDFPISQLAYILGEQGQKELWTRDSKVLMQFVVIGNKLGFIQLEKKNNELIFTRYPGIKAVIHKEKTGHEGIGDD